MTEKQSLLGGSATSSYGGAQTSSLSSNNNHNEQDDDDEPVQLVGNQVADPGALGELLGAHVERAAAVVVPEELVEHPVDQLERDGVQHDRADDLVDPALDLQVAGDTAPQPSRDGADDDDEDGVSIPPLVQGQSASLTLSVTSYSPRVRKKAEIKTCESLRNAAY